MYQCQPMSVSCRIRKLSMRKLFPRRPRPSPSELGGFFFSIFSSKARLFSKMTFSLLVLSSISVAFFPLDLPPPLPQVCCPPPLFPMAPPYLPQETPFFSCMSSGKNFGSVYGFRRLRALVRLLEGPCPPRPVLFSRFFSTVPSLGKSTPGLPFLL